MKLKELKQILNTLTDKQLEKPLMYNGESLSISGEIESFTKIKETLYWTGEDDPSELYTKKQLIEDYDYDKEMISELEPAFNKGDYALIF